MPWRCADVAERLEVVECLKRAWSSGRGGLIGGIGPKAFGPEALPGWGGGVVAIGGTRA